MENNDKFYDELYKSWLYKKEELEELISDLKFAKNNAENSRSLYMIINSMNECINTAIKNDEILIKLINSLEKDKNKKEQQDCKQNNVVLTDKEKILLIESIKKNKSEIN